MPHTLRSIQVTDEQVAELTMLCGFDDDLAAQIAQVANRVRGLLTQIHPALERAIGPRLNHAAILDLLQRYPSPADLRAAGEKRIAARMLKLAPPKGGDWTHEIIAALGEQAVVVTGTNAAALVIPRRAAQLTILRRQRGEVAAEVEKLVDAHPHQPVLTSMPGVGVWTAARLLTEVAGKHFPTARRSAVLYAMLRDGTLYQGRHTLSRPDTAFFREFRRRDGVVSIHPFVVPSSKHFRTSRPLSLTCAKTSSASLPRWMPISVRHSRYRMNVSES